MLPWVSEDEQRRGDALIVDLGRVVRPCAVRLSLGPHAGLYPRTLRISTSVDGEHWKPVLTEKTGGQALLAAVARPRDPQLSFSISEAAPARYVSLQLDADHPKIGWAVATLLVSGSPLE